MSDLGTPGLLGHLPGRGPGDLGRRVNLQLGHPASARSSSTIVARPPKTMAAPTT